MSSKSSARILFMGTPDFAVPSLEACAEVGEVVAVVTQPDRPAGRGRQLTAPPTKRWAQERAIAVLQPERVREPQLRAQLAAFDADVAVVAAYGRILPPALLELPRLGCLNVHASLLPRYRGAAPIQWAIANGDRETGVTLMRMAEGLDTGPILAARSIPIGDDETGGTMHERLAALGGALLREELPRYLAGALTAVPQREEEATLAPILKKEDGRLELALPAALLCCRIRGFSPWPGATLTVSGRPLKIHRAVALPGTATAAAPGASPGTLLAATSEGIDLACGEGILRLLEIQPEGGRRMRVADYLAGHEL